ncbi:lysozyme inhibitor LprI family protein [Octadecabacter sp. 1_MG-2023]|uniref:lysozyme inhibitor LprI family protein n=1 Tax=unclassified Octadecabacter TaxID=196158 RepID=UPI00209094EC|nr:MULTISPECIES: lysozyme inhibitor LprI family protein [unclassified Octadecabacter]MDO6735328.1 lysozyme inhibitor LprI family protein [Octadecabacter sp. 1_MG-2023]
MTHFVRSIAACALIAGPAAAEPQPAVAALMHYMEVVETCFDNAGDSEAAHACIGQGASLCMDTEADGYTTVGMMFCSLAEHEEWDRLLNETYTKTMAFLERDDAAEAESFPEFANRADSLRAAQRAWIPFRDADCSLEYAMWGAGSMRQIAGAGCRLRMTAERTIFLRFLGDQMR